MYEALPVLSSSWSFCSIVSDYLDIFIIAALKVSPPLTAIYFVTMARLKSYSQTES